MSRHTWQQNVTTVIQPLHRELQAQIPKRPFNYAHSTHEQPTTRCRTARENQFAPGTTEPQPPHTHTHARYLSSPPAATLYGKTQGFLLQLPPQNKPHATVMRPLQCVLQHDVANPHVSTHMATVLRLPPQPKSQATFMQPLQCVLLRHMQIHSARHHFP